VERISLAACAAVVYVWHCKSFSKLRSISMVLRIFLRVA